MLTADPTTVPHCVIVQVVIMKRKQKPLKSTLTLEQVVAACTAAGATVTFGLVPKELDVAAGWQSTPAGEKLQKLEVSLALSGSEALPAFTLTDKDWPGGPSCRSILASAASDAVVAKEFKDCPSSQWVITADRILERGEFFKQMQALKDKPQATSDKDMVHPGDPAIVNPS
jgi:hypothetical protein